MIVWLPEGYCYFTHPVLVSKWSCWEQSCSKVSGPFPFIFFSPFFRFLMFFFGIVFFIFRSSNVAEIRCVREGVLSFRQSVSVIYIRYVL